MVTYRETRHDKRDKQGRTGQTRQVTAAKDDNDSYLVN